MFKFDMLQPFMNLFYKHEERKFVVSSEMSNKSNLCLSHNVQTHTYIIDANTYFS